MEWAKRKQRPMLMDLDFDVTPQPDDVTCGPACLHAVYRYFGREVPWETVLREVPMLEDGGTLAAHLGMHALQEGFSATLHTFNLRVFDPTWFTSGSTVDLRAKLDEQRRHKRDRKFRAATDAYLQFLEAGGEVRLADSKPTVFQSPLRRGVPVLTGLSSTFLYSSARERPTDDVSDDVRGQPVGHFVVLCGFDAASRKVKVGDPLGENPWAPEHVYRVSVDRVLGAILLGVLTYDANLLVLEPREDADPLRKAASSGKRKGTRGSRAVGDTESTRRGS